MAVYGIIILLIYTIAYGIIILLIIRQHTELYHYIILLIQTYGKIGLIRIISSAQYMAFSHIR